MKSIVSMKRIALFTSFFLVGFTSFSQIGVKLYGYVREVTPGTVPRGTGENGENISRAKPQPTYLVYLSAPSKHPVSAIEMWIKGERFSLRTEPMTQTPVVVPTNTRKTITLVAKTSNKVQQLIAVPFTEGKEFSLAKKKAAANELVVVYRQNGKYYSATLKKVTQLEPQFNE